MTSVVERYKDRTSLYTFGHQWNLAWVFCSNKGTYEYDKLLVEALYDASLNIKGKVYRYQDYIQEILVNPITISGNWCFNIKRSYGEEEQAKFLGDSIASILEAKKHGVPITCILANLLDKNEDSSGYAFDRWLFVPEGLYKMRGEIDSLRRGPTTWAVAYDRKQAADTYQRIASQRK